MQTGESDSVSPKTDLYKGDFPSINNSQSENRPNMRMESADSAKPHVPQWQASSEITFPAMHRKTEMAPVHPYSFPRWAVPETLLSKDDTVTLYPSHMLPSLQPQIWRHLYLYAYFLPKARFETESEKQPQPRQDILLLLDNIPQFRGIHTAGTGKVPNKEEAEFVLHTTIYIWNIHQK